MAVFLGFDDSDRDVGLIVQGVVGALLCPTRMKLATNDDALLGEAHFLPNLRVEIPASCGDGRGDVLGADIALR